MTFTKALSRVEIKDADKGTVAAVFSTFDVIDSDGDVTLKGAFTDGAPAAISAYGHMSWKGVPPVGKGHIRELSSEAVFEGRFFLDTQSGADTFTVVKELAAEDGPGQQWSYGLRNVQSEIGTHDGKRVRFLKSIDVPEVSPVLLGAGVDTRTLEAKGLKQPNSEVSAALRNAGRERWGSDDTYVWPEDFDLDEGWAIFSISSHVAAERLVRVDFTRDADGALLLGSDESDVERTVGYAPKSHTFLEHVQSVRADLGALATRATEVMALRAQKGKALSTATVDEMAALIADTAQLKALLTATPPNPDDDNEVFAREYLRFVASTQET